MRRRPRQEHLWQGSTFENLAEAENVYGERITIDSHCHINGVILYTDELRLGEGFSIAKDLKEQAPIHYRRTDLRFLRNSQI